MKTETDVILAIKKIYKSKLKNNVISIKTNIEVTESPSDIVNSIRYDLLKLGAFESRFGGFFFNADTASCFKVSIFIREYTENSICKHQVDIKIG